MTSGTCITHPTHCGSQNKVLDRTAVFITRQRMQRRTLAGVVRALRNCVVEVCILRTAMMTVMHWQTHRSTTTRICLQSGLSMVKRR